MAPKTTMALRMTPNECCYIFKLVRHVNRQLFSKNISVTSLLKNCMSVL